MIKELLSERRISSRPFSTHDLMTGLFVNNYFLGLSCILHLDDSIIFHSYFSDLELGNMIRFSRLKIILQDKRTKFWPSSRKEGLIVSCSICFSVHVHALHSHVFNFDFKVLRKTRKSFDFFV